MMINDKKQWLFHQAMGLTLIGILSVLLAVGSNMIRKDSIPWIDQRRLLKAGDNYPYVPLPTTKICGNRNYLGLPENKEIVTTEDIRADLLIIEVLNVFCFPCQTQALSLNKVYQMIEERSNLNEKIKIMGIALGNTREVLEGFMDDYGLLFPVIPDPTLRAEKIIGPGIHTPFSLFIKRDALGRLRFVAATHNGAIEDPQIIFNGLLQLLKTEPGITITDNIFNGTLSQP